MLIYLNNNNGTTYPTTLDCNRIISTRRDIDELYFGRNCQCNGKEVLRGSNLRSEIYDKRKALDINNKFNLDESIEVHRAKGADLDKNTTKGKILSFLLMSQE